MGITRFMGAAGLVLGLGLAAMASAASQVAPKIVMYVMPGCSYCEGARSYFNAHGLSWSEIDITASEAASADFKQRGGQGTPLILVDGTAVHGFNAQRMDQVLGTAKP